MSSFTSKHPQYALMAPDWETMRDTYAGERLVKERGEKYLMPTPGMTIDGMKPGQPGYASYDAYRSRALFHDFVREGVEYYIGLLHQKPPTIELPSQLEKMRDDATILHETLEQLLRKINEQQLVVGRFGMMLDIPADPAPGQDTPYIATYLAEAITNWDIGSRDQIDVPELNLVVLDESNYQRVQGSFEWKWVQQYRVLTLGPAGTNEETGAYKQGLFTGQAATFDESKLIAPNIKGQTLEHIPFVFVNAQDMLVSTDICPLMGLAKLALAIYRGEADYRQNLFMQGQDTLVIVGGKDDDQVRTGAGSIIQLKATAGSDAKYIGVTSTGLSEQREALENDKTQARNKSGQLIDTRSKQKESGQAIQTRVAAQAATLNAIAKTGAAALEQILKAAAVWLKADPEKVKVTANDEFTDQQLLAADLVQLQTAKTLGAPISEETIHDIMLQRGMTQLTYEEEMEKIAEEAPVMGTGTTAGGNPVLDPGLGKPVVDPKTGKTATAPGGAAEDQKVVIDRTEKTAKANSAGKPAPKKVGKK